jgi:hypothetical protein
VLDLGPETVGSVAVWHVMGRNSNNNGNEVLDYVISQGSMTLARLGLSVSLVAGVGLNATYNYSSWVKG